jgi:hypothetical protein
MEGVAVTGGTMLPDPEDPPQPASIGNISAARIALRSNGQSSSSFRRGVRAHRRSRYVRGSNSVVGAVTSDLAKIAATPPRMVRVLAPVREKGDTFITIPVGKLVR